jgi:hypothetical protein
MSAYPKSVRRVIELGNIMDITSFQPVDLLEERLSVVFGGAE